jgi:acyl-CoA synthetase (AMP-forming)/AMP-acid ligase II
MLSTGMTMGEAIRSVSAARPDQEVFVCGATRLTNRALVARVDSTARRLAALGIRKGDRVACLLAPGPEFASLFFAVASLGAVIVPLNPELRERSLREILDDAQPAALASGEQLDGEIARRTRVIRAEELAAAGDAPAPGVAVAPSDLLALMYTSGTTGRPKATMHTHASLIAAVVATLKVRELWLRPSNLRTVAEIARALARYRGRMIRSVGKPQTIMTTMGWHTITGLHVMLQGLLMGDRLAAMSRFRPQEALELVQRERVTVLVAVPTAYRAMLALPDFARFDVSSLLVCAAGGAACPPQLAREIQRGFGCALYNGFGLTEAAGGIAVSGLADSDRKQAETVGKPMPGIEVRIVDEQRRELARGAVGELAVRGEGVMQGYYHAPELTARTIDRDGWLYTGDMARIDDEGYLHIVGRKKDLIVRGGQNIYPAEIEHYLATHPLIAEAAVVGVPSPIGGESVWAFVRPKENARLTVQEVLDFCRGTLEIYQIPSEVRFVAELPQAEAGKSQKFKLRELAVRELAGGGT